MLKNKMLVFMAKRVLICCILLSIIDMIWMKQRWSILAGLIVGSIFSVVKFGSYTWVLSKVAAVDNAQIKKPARSSILVFFINQILLFPALLAAYFLNIWFFTGVVAGILLVPFAMMINCVTEASGISHNNFE